MKTFEHISILSSFSPSGPKYMHDIIFKDTQCKQMLIFWLFLIVIAFE